MVSSFLQILMGGMLSFCFGVVLTILDDQCEKIAQCSEEPPVALTSNARVKAGQLLMFVVEWRSEQGRQPLLLRPA